MIIVKGSRAPPDEQAQVDWAEVGSQRDESGKKRKVYAFMTVLGFSRMLYVEFTLRMRIEDLIRCHQNAFGCYVMPKRM